MWDYAWVIATIKAYQEDIAELKQRAPDDIITCPLCKGDPVDSALFCGCNGTMKVSEAIKFFEGEIEILEK